MAPRFWLVVRWMVGIAILAAIATNIEFGRLSHVWEPTTLLHLTGAAAVLTGAQVVSAGRWKILLLEDDVTWPFLTRLYLIGTFFSAFLPTSVGGDAVRAGALARAGVSVERSLASIVLDRLLGVAGMVPLFAAGALLMTMNPATLLGGMTLEASLEQIVAVAIGVAVAASIAAFIFRERLRDRVQQLKHEMSSQLESPGKLMMLLGLGIAVQAMYVCAWGILAPATGLQIGWTVLLFAVPVVSIAAMLPVSIAGLGVREGVWILLLGSGFAMTDVVAFSLLYFVAYSLTGVVGGVLYMLKGISSRRHSEPAGDVTAPDAITS